MCFSSTIMRIYKLKYGVIVEKMALIHFQKSGNSQFENEASGGKTKMDTMEIL